MEGRLSRRIKARWSDVLLVCARCSRRLDGGFGPKGRTPLAKALRKHLGLRKGRKGAFGIVEVKCLGVCPRGAVTTVRGAAPGEWVLVAKGADLDAVAEALIGQALPVRHEP